MLEEIKRHKLPAKCHAHGSAWVWGLAVSYRQPPWSSSHEPFIVAPMTGSFADRLFRITFALAGVYNLAFGIWAGFWPLAFFELFQLEPPRYPGIWACLGMVVGVYGLLYWHAAWKLETGWPIIAVGLLGKVLGPIGMALSISDVWPRRLGMLCITNDLIWWLPFALFLIRGTRLADGIARFAPWICAGMHTLALCAMAFILQPGTLVVTSVAERGRYVAEQATAWSVGWGIWMLAAMSLVGFYAWWGSRLRARTAAVVSVLLAACGLVFDLSGEGLSVFTLVEQAQTMGSSHSAFPPDTVGYEKLERTITLLTAGASNLFYTLGGVVLTLATPNLPRWVRAMMWTTWIAGLAMTLAGVTNHVGGMVATTAVLFPLLIVWTIWMGVRMTNGE